MKITKKALLPILCGMLCFALLACATGGGGGGGAAADGFGPGVPVSGLWVDYTDDNDGGDSTVSMEETEVDGVPALRFTGNVTTRFQYGFVGWALQPDEETLELLKNARAISFMTKGDGKRQTVKYRISSVRDHAHFEFHFVAEEEPTRVEVPIRFFQQPSWGTPARMNQDNAEDISWQTHESWRPGTFDVTIWDVRIH